MTRVKEINKIVKAKFVSWWCFFFILLNWNKEREDDSEETKLMNNEKLGENEKVNVRENKKKIIKRMRD